jgi:hypothetical protein
MVESVLKYNTDVEGADFSCLQCSEGNVAVGFSGETIQELYLHLIQF